MPIEGQWRAQATAHLDTAPRVGAGGGQLARPTQALLTGSAIDERGQQRAQQHLAPAAVPATAREPAASSVKFVGVTSPRGELLRSPVLGTPCVHWRLRIVEQVNGTLQLVHEMASSEDFDVTWSGTGNQTGLVPAGAGGHGGIKVRVVPQTARIEATPVLHRPGSPGALATGRHFGLHGHLSVEEVALRPGEEIVAEGILEQLDGGTAGPFRGVQRELELFEATVRLPTRVALAPVLLPWALGTAAALLGGVGLATWAARRFDLLPDLHHGSAVPAANTHSMTRSATGSSMTGSMKIGPMIYTGRLSSRPQ